MMIIPLGNAISHGKSFSNLFYSLGIFQLYVDPSTVNHPSAYVAYVGVESAPTPM